MAQYYSDPSRENEEHALPDLEVFYLTRSEAKEMARERGELGGFAGWYYWFCFPGCLPDSDPIGPFETEAEALADAREGQEE